MRVDLTVDQLRRLRKRYLFQLWQQLIGCPAPPRTRPELLRLGIAWHLQTDREGGLKPKVRRRLERIARTIDEGGLPSQLAQPRIRPGTTIIKEWGGEQHTVTVLPQGYLYKDNTYNSLSEIARTITGTRWNGPAFFGLRKNKKGEARAG